MATAAAHRDDESGYPKPAYAWYVVSLVFVGYAFAFIDRIIVGVLLTSIQKDFSISDTQGGLLAGLGFALFYTLFGLPLGMLTDRWNRKWLLTIGMTIWSLATACCGLATSFGGLFLARLGVGFGEGTLNPCATSLIGDYFPPKVRPRAFGLYVMGTAIGTGFTYLVSGLLLGWLARNGGLDFPVVGHLGVWQSTFMLVGLPGLIPALMFLLTAREPARREVADKTKGKASPAEILAFWKQNRGALICHHAGIALVLMCVYGFVTWLPAFFLRVHGWEPARFAFTYGLYGMFAGMFSAISAGWFATWLKGRGYLDGTLRACVIGCSGCVLGGVLGPLMPTPELALTVYILTGLFANYPSVLGLASIAEVTPNEMRGIVTAIYIMLIGLVSSGVGPLAVGVVTDSVFGDKAAIGKSMMIVSLITGVSGVSLLAYGLKAYRESLARAVATWSKAG